MHTPPPFIDLHNAGYHRVHAAAKLVPVRPTRGEIESHTAVQRAWYTGKTTINKHREYEHGGKGHQASSIRQQKSRVRG